MTVLARDVGYGLRQLRRSSGFGATTAVVSFVGAAAPRLIFGLAGAVAAGRALRAFLYQVTPTDPVVLGLVATGVAPLATAAALVPARRAANTHAMAALRAD